MISEVLGSRKPDPALFQAAAAACGRELNGGWIVGDSPEADVGGAVNCGLRSVWIHRGRDWEVPAYRPTAIAATVTEAVAHILAAGPTSESR